MTHEEYNEEATPLLEELPPELRAAVSYMAYENGHSAGYEEVLNELRGMVGSLKEPLAALEKRLRAEGKLYRIHSVDEYGEDVWWSNSDGWVRDGYTLFTAVEKEKIPYLPKYASHSNWQEA